MMFVPKDRLDIRLSHMNFPLSLIAPPRSTIQSRRMALLYILGSPAGCWGMAFCSGHNNLCGMADVTLSFYYMVPRAGNL